MLKRITAPDRPAPTDAETQFALGVALAAGNAPHDYPQAMNWYQLAADQDHRLAQFNLGQMYAQGQGMPKSDSLALKWFHRAAQGGDAGAQFHLGERQARACVHGTETGAAESRIEAYKWFTLSAAQSYGTAQVRADSATGRMTREEVAEGNRRVRAFAAG